MKIDFNTETNYSDDDKYRKAKLKTNKGNITTNFYNKKIPEEKIPHKCLSKIILDSIL